MLLRATLVAVTAAVLVPFMGGAAHASCLDDLSATNLSEGYVQSPKSEYWSAGYVELSGTATVEVHGDELVSDYRGFVLNDSTTYASILVGNTERATTGFVDCVAG